MTKMEFAQLTGAAFTDAEWKLIETVYLYYPAIAEATRKTQIAYLWEAFGPILLRDMLPTARQAQLLEASLEGARARVREAENDVAEFRRTGQPPGLVQERAGTR